MFDPMFLDLLEKNFEEGKISQNIKQHFLGFYQTYMEAAKKNGCQEKELIPLFITCFNLVLKELENPSSFEPYHKAVFEPFDYYQFGLDFMRPLVVQDKSVVKHIERIDQMASQIKRGENVVLLSNHQTEADPQAISLMLEKTHPEFAKNMIFVAGHRVTSDPMSIPFSKGRNLLCIYSKRHIDYPPENKNEKLLHNQKTVWKISELLSEGGKCIYVAPSGGRDRPGKDGSLEVAPFDPESVEMFWLLAKRSRRKTHFYPLALSTYKLLPPPDSIEKELGESRRTESTPLYMSIAPEVDMDNFPGSESLDRNELRIKRADYIWNEVRSEYGMFPKEVL